MVGGFMHQEMLQGAHEQSRNSKPFILMAANQLNSLSCNFPLTSLRAQDELSVHAPRQNRVHTQSAALVTIACGSDGVPIGSAVNGMQAVLVGLPFGYLLGINRRFPVVSKQRVPSRNENRRPDPLDTKMNITAAVCAVLTVATSSKGKELCQPAQYLLLSRFCNRRQTDTTAGTQLPGRLGVDKRGKAVMPLQAALPPSAGAASAVGLACPHPPLPAARRPPSRHLHGCLAQCTPARPAGAALHRVN